MQPYLPLLATKATEEVGKIWGAIKKKFGTKEAAREALGDLLKDPQSEAYQTVFKVQLEKVLTNDQAFAAELSELLQAAGSDFKGQVIGGGALAQGDHSTAVGQGSIYIGGNARDVKINTNKDE